jgi:hypothetical protein
LTVKRHWWWLSGPVLIVAAFALSAIAPESGLTYFLTALAWIWLVISLCILAWRLWRWMTYRVGVRLFITYLLIGGRCSSRQR